MIAGDRTIVAPNASLAWADTVACLLDRHPHEAVNLAIRIEDPLGEQPEIRRIADQGLARLGLQEITEVANTIFPAEWAIDFPEPAELATDYREHYDFIRSLGNAFGTYFGRIVAYPDPDSGETIDQLADTVTKLREAAERGRTYTSVYEINIYSAAKDRHKQRGFPCLSHIGMHVGDDDRLHATAQYRSHDIIAKGYGNYLGLGGLLAYIARAAEREPGELLVIAGRAFFDAPLTGVRGMAVTLEPLRSAAG